MKIVFPVWEFNLVFDLMTLNPTSLAAIFNSRYTIISMNFTSSVLWYSLEMCGLIPAQYQRPTGWDYILWKVFVLDFHLLSITVSTNSVALRLLIRPLVKLATIDIVKKLTEIKKQLEHIQVASPALFYLRTYFTENWFVVDQDCLTHLDDVGSNLWIAYWRIQYWDPPNSKSVDDRIHA